MASSTERRQVVRGRPPGLAGGSSGATRAHAASLRFVSYSVSRIVPCPRNRAGRDHGDRPVASRVTLFAPPLTVLARAHAHEDANAVRDRYRRSDLFDRRAPLMAAWAEHCEVEAALPPTQRSRAAGS